MISLLSAPAPESRITINNGSPGRRGPRQSAGSRGSNGARGRKLEPQGQAASKSMEICHSLRFASGLNLGCDAGVAAIFARH